MDKGQGLQSGILLFISLVLNVESRVKKVFFLMFEISFNKFDVTFYYVFNSFIRLIFFMLNVSKC